MPEVQFRWGVKQAVIASDGSKRASGVVVRTSQWINRWGDTIQDVLIQRGDGSILYATSDDYRLIDKATGARIGNTWYVVRATDEEDGPDAQENLRKFRFDIGESLWVRHQTYESEYVNKDAAQDPSGMLTRPRYGWYSADITHLIWDLKDNAYQTVFTRTLLPESIALYRQLQQPLPSQIIDEPKRPVVYESDAISALDPAPALTAGDHRADGTPVLVEARKPAPKREPQPAPEPEATEDESADMDESGKKGPRKPKYVHAESKS